MGVSADQVITPTAIHANNTPNHLTCFMGLLLDGGGNKGCSLLQQNADVMCEVVGAVPVGHQGAKAPATIDQIDV
jgi:hypothetical protein